MKNVFFVLAFMLIGTFVFASNETVKSLEIEAAHHPEIVINVLEEAPLHTCGSLGADLVDYWVDSAGVDVATAIQAGDAFIAWCEAGFPGLFR